MASRATEEGIGGTSTHNHARMLWRLKGNRSLLAVRLGARGELAQSADEARGGAGSASASRSNVAENCGDSGRK